MDYEKKYKEALERAEEIIRYYKEHNRGDETSIEDLEQIFSELKESEDERIRKELVTHCRNTRCVTEEGAERIAKWIAWLEMQGANVDINPSEFEMRLNRLLKQFESLPKEDIVSSLSFYLNVIQNDGTYKAEEKQGEQKHAWSEEDEEMTEDLIKGCVSSVSPYQLTHTSKEIVDWLISLKCRMKGKEE